MRRLFVAAMLSALTLALLWPAAASLAGTAFGFPAITQTGTTTSFDRDTAAATDNSAFGLSWPGFSDNDLAPGEDLSATGIPEMVLPSIDQIFGSAFQSVPLDGTMSGTIPNWMFS